MLKGPLVGRNVGGDRPERKDGPSFTLGEKKEWPSAELPLVCAAAIFDKVRNAGYPESALSERRLDCETSLHKERRQLTRKSQVHWKASSIRRPMADLAVQTVDVGLKACDHGISKCNSIQELCRTLTQWLNLFGLYGII